MSVVDLQENSRNEEVRLMCPVCRRPLEASVAFLSCPECQTNFAIVDGFPDLIVGGRFEDEGKEELMRYEEECNADTTRNYWIPLMERSLPDGSASRVLSVGCGTGVDVDLLSNCGYTAVGIDCGKRTETWRRRERKNRLFMANGKHLPFEDNLFDLAFCGCVFPHVGVVGDTFQVTDRYFEDRLELAREMSRVVKPGGRIVVSSPNRFFPCDIFHGRESGTYRPRPYWPGDPFLLSVSDYRELFRQAGCTRARALPVQGYWGFIRSRHSWKGRLVGMPVRLMFWMVSLPGMNFLRGSPLNPWIVVMIEK